VKDAEQGQKALEEDPFASATWNKKLLKRVAAATKVPSFMDSRAANALSRTPEIWMSTGTCPAGAKAHVDVHTESTLSLQLDGRKSWKVAPPSRRARPHVMKLYRDGQIHEREEAKRWDIFEEVVLEKGDAMIFAPGFIHQTRGMSDFTASITWQFDAPAPVLYWRRFLPRLRWTPDLEHTWEILRSLIERGKAEGVSKEDALAFLDVDADGKVSKAERSSLAALWKALDARFDELPALLRKKQLGRREVVEDHGHLQAFSSKVRKAVLDWEQQCYKLDEDAFAATADARAQRQAEL